MSRLSWGHHPLLHFFMQLQSREMQRPAFSSNFPHHHMFVRLSLWPDDKNHYSNNVEFLGCVCDWHVFLGSSYPPKKAKKKLLCVEKQNVWHDGSNIPLKLQGGIFPFHNLVVLNKRNWHEE